MSGQTGIPARGNEILTDDPQRALDRLKDFTRRLLAVPKSDIPKHVPTPQAKPRSKKKK